MYLFERVTEAEGRARASSHRLVRSPDACSSRGEARSQKLRPGLLPGWQGRKCLGGHLRSQARWHGTGARVEAALDPLSRSPGP